MRSLIAMPESKRSMERVTNLDTWNDPSVAAYYSSLEYLTPCEQLVFNEYLSAGMAILDLGVGGGRTTPYLSAIAGAYIGADYAVEMIAACRKKFPNLQFELVDAADLSIFAGACFDAVVMAFNTIDNLIPDEARQRALQELRRVLKPNGILIFSSHNIRSIFARPRWNRQRPVSVAKQMVSVDSVLYRPLLWGLTGGRLALAVFQALGESVVRAARRGTTRAFWVGEGYLRDATHGGTNIHHSTPKTTQQELQRFGFSLLRVLGDDHPKRSHRYVTDWYYYVFASAANLPKEPQP